MPGTAMTLARNTMMQRRPRSAADMVAGELGTEQARGGTYDENASGSRGRYLDFLGGGQDALNEYIRSAVSAGMPQLDANLQGARENANSRGVALGELGTSYEGDVYSAFHKHITDAAGAQAMNLYGTQERGYSDVYGTDTNLAEGSRSRYLDLVTGQRDYELAKANANRKRKGGLLGGLLGVAGGVGGFMIGGPAGAAAGASIGSGLGQGIGGY